MKYSYYVALIESNNHIKYVTSIDNSTHSARWDAGQPAKKFTKAVAEDVAFGLVVNGFPAAVLKMPTGYKLANNE